MVRSTLLLLLILLPALFLAGQGSTGEGAPVAAEAASAATRPNIVLIVLDDLDELTLQVALSEGLMPTFQRLFVSGGMRFRESFVTNSLCCPSRATFLTGQYSHNHNALTNLIINGAVTAFDDRSTIATWLQGGGYRTGHIGKYLHLYGHNFDMGSGVPGARAADPISPQAAPPAYRLRPFAPGYVPPGWDSWHGLISRSAYCIYNYSVNSNGRIHSYMKDGRVLAYPSQSRGATPVEIAPPLPGDPAHNYQTDVLADLAVGFIQGAVDDPGRPFFLQVMPLAPHAEDCGSADPDGPQGNMWRTYRDGFKLHLRPAARHQTNLPRLRQVGRRLFNLQAPLRASFNEADMNDKPLEYRERFQPLNSDTNGNGRIDPREDDVTHLVNQFATRVASLAAVDDMLARLVDSLEQQGLADNTVLLFTSDNGWLYGEHRMTSKLAAYEEAIRVPLYIRAPGLAAGAVSQSMVSNNDIAPTIAELAGVTPTLETDGRSLVPLLQNPAHSPWRRYLLIEHYLSTWDSDNIRFIDLKSFFAVRTARDAPLPNRVYIQHYDGLQTYDSYYLSKTEYDARTPAGQYLWERAPIDVELYTLNTDPYQLDNKLWQVEQRGNRARLLQEQAFLRDRLLGLVNCQGAGCRSAEE
jgi:N-acetylglucosamine-6-sulfatase